MRDSMGKYRGRREDGAWVYGCFLDTGKGSSPYETYILSDKASCMDEYDEVDPETVGEFTGLKDRAGKDIYEGDVVKSGMTGESYIICWSDEKSAWYKQMIDANTADRPIFEDNSASRVVSTIHDSPELLEKSQEEGR